MGAVLYSMKKMSVTMIDNPSCSVFEYSCRPARETLLRTTKRDSGNAPLKGTGPSIFSEPCVVPQGTAEDGLKQIAPTDGRSRRCFKLPIETLFPSRADFPRTDREGLDEGTIALTT